MDGIDIMYFILNNWISVIGIVTILGYWFWQTTIRNAELKIEEERKRVECKKQKMCIQMAIEKFQQDRNKFLEKEEQMQKIIKRIEQDNQNLRDQHREIQNEINEERRRRRAQNREDERRNRRELEQAGRNENRNNTDEIMQIIERSANIIGNMALLFVAGRAALK